MDDDNEDDDDEMSLESELNLNDLLLERLRILPGLRVKTASIMMSVFCVALC